MLKSNVMQKHGKDSRAKIFEQNWEIVAVNYQSFVLKCEHGTSEISIKFNDASEHILVDFLSFEALDNSQTSIKLGARTSNFTNMKPEVVSGTGTTVDENRGEVAPFELITARIYELDELKDFPLWIKPDENLYFPFTCDNAASFVYVRVHARIIMIQPISESFEIPYSAMEQHPLEALSLFKNQSKHLVQPEQESESEIPVPLEDYLDGDEST
ncbi:hypothetical protein [Candidatus Lokiarchaeum ossiferum]|uniref:hypothetical protein n=1 Tax=Candidatus Lokiarchaeum ossiferum TaxID=2951803 RepID=UPI00352FBBDA